MIPYKVFEPLAIGPLHINFYGFFFALGTLAVILLARNFAKKKGIDVEMIEDLSLYLILGTVIGARLFFVLFYWPAGTPFSFLDIFKIWEGGLAFFGGFLGALTAGFIYAKKKNLDFLTIADIFTIPLIVGHILGRIGGYLTGGHPGKIADLPWSIYLNGELRHPVILYEIIGLLIILTIVYNLNKKFKLKKGVLFAIYVALYSIQRLFLDIFRAEAFDPRTLGLTPSQYLVIGLFLVAIYYIYNQFKKDKTLCIKENKQEKQKEVKKQTIKHNKKSKNSSKKSKNKIN